MFLTLHGLKYAQLMKFNVSSKALYSFVAAVGKVINAKNALTILNNFKVSLADDLLTITASDGENFLEGRLPVSEAEGEGSACIDARRLSDLLKDLPDVGITVTIDNGPGGSYAVNVAFANGEFDFMGFDGADFPVCDAPDSLDSALQFTAPASKFIRGIDHTIFAVGQDDLRPQMMGILWDVKPDALVMVATDTRKLVKFTDFSIQAGEEGRFIMPLKAMTVFKNVFARQDDVKVTAHSKGVTFESVDFTFNSRFLKGAFPDYNRVIPHDNPYTLTIDRQGFQSAVRRIGAFCDAANGLVRFKVTPDKLILKASETAFNSKAWESCPASFNAPNDLVIGFSAPYVSEILATITSPEVNVLLSDPSRSGVFIPSENDQDTELLMLLMPMIVAEF